jgi:hypothetical protein
MFFGEPHPVGLTDTASDVSVVWFGADTGLVYLLSEASVGVDRKKSSTHRVHVVLRAFGLLK